MRVPNCETVFFLFSSFLSYYEMVLGIVQWVID